MGIIKGYDKYYKRSFFTNKKRSKKSERLYIFKYRNIKDEVVYRLVRFTSGLCSVNETVISNISRKFLEKTATIILQKEENKMNKEELKRQLNKMIQLSLKNPCFEGFTMDVAGNLGGFRGYAVSKTDNEISLDNYHIYLDEYVDYVASGCKRIVGLWFDKENNKYYLDCGLLVGRLGLAKLIAEEFNQKAIYDFDNKEVIYV